MGIQEKIKDIEFEMSRTQKNKATEFHLGLLKAKLAKLRTQLLEPAKGVRPRLPSARTSSSAHRGLSAAPGLLC